MSRIDLILAEALELPDDERAQLLREGTAKTLSAQDALSMARAAVAARRA